MVHGSVHYSSKKDIPEMIHLILLSAQEIMVLEAPGRGRPC